MKIVVHDGTFHADDVFTVASLKRLYPDAEIIRTRDEAIISVGDIVADVGGIYDADKNRFDHHQMGGAGMRINGIPYAAVGLVWKKFGEQIAGSKEAALIIENRLIAAIDGPDNGVALSEGFRFKETLPYNPGAMVEAFNPTWREDEALEDAYFMKAVAVAALILEREIVRANDAVIGYQYIREAYRAATDKRVIVLDKSYPWLDIASSFPELLFVILPDADRWKVRTVSDGVFKNRKDFPISWAGLRDADLAKVTGVPDALFCHNKRFIVVAQSKEGALALAKLALQGI